MATDRDLDRAQAISNFGRNCFFCTTGPLQRRGLFIMPLGYRGMDVPLCKSCRDHFEGGGSEVALVKQLRKHANAVIKATREHATAGGYRIEAVSEVPLHLSHED